MSGLSRKHSKIQNDIFHDPICSDVAWKDIEALIIALGGEVSEGKGSRVRIYLNGIRAVFQRPHPQCVTEKSALKSMRRFLTEAGIKYDEI